MRVAVSGAAGRMGRLVARAVEAAADLEIGGRYDPHGQGEVSADPEVVRGAAVVVEFTRPDVVMENLARWKAFGVHAVVGTSGFDAGRLDEVRGMWGAGPPNCLVVPNFAIGAVVLMRLAEIAAPHFEAAEVVELHHDGKVDAPSGTAIATAERIAAAAPGAVRPGEGRGSDVAGVPVHAVRLPGLVAHQEVLFGTTGQTLAIRHDTTDREAFVPGVLAAVRRVADLPGVSVGLEAVLGLT